MMSLPLAELEDASRRIAATAARLEKIGILSALLRRLAPDEIETVVAWLSGELRQGRIGLGPAAIHEAARVPGAEHATLSVAEVDATFARIASVSGTGSVRERTRELAALLARATPGEKGLILRVVSGELRQGALEGVMEEAIARASDLPAVEIRRAVMRAGSLRAVAHAALTEGRAGLARFTIQVFRPLQPMLAQAADGLDEALERLGAAALEYKMDGARVQLHKRGDDVRVYSRSLKDVTHAVPELVEGARTFPAVELILDGEVIALRPDGTPHTFPTTMRRFGRKLDVAGVRNELPLTPFYFDALRIDDQDLVTAPARERFAALDQVARGFVVPRRLTSAPEEAKAFLEEALERGHEGLMAKSPESAYEAGSRGAGWLKVKAAHTLDLVVLAVEWGSGRREGWLSNIHMGARDPASGGFRMLGKTFKGMTDAILEWQTHRFQELAVATEGHVVHVRPEQVVEIAFNDVQRSTYTDSGMALRFARVKRYRMDKTAAEADTVDTVRAILENDERGGRRGGR
jgi:DNA ligase 1